MLRGLHNNAFTRFLLIGGFASGVSLVSRIIINRATSYEVAIVLAFVIATTTAFFLHRAFVFKAATNQRAAFARFVLVNLATLVQIFVLSLLFARWVFPAMGMRFYPETVAHAIGLCSPILTSYWAHKHFTFRPGSDASRL